MGIEALIIDGINNSFSNVHFTQYTTLANYSGEHVNFGIDNTLVKDPIHPLHGQLVPPSTKEKLWRAKDTKRRKGDI